MEGTEDRGISIQGAGNEEWWGNGYGTMRGRRGGRMKGRVVFSEETRGGAGMVTTSENATENHM